MARFVIDGSRLNFNIQRQGKEYELRVLQRAQTVFSTLLGLLPSNYTSTIQGPNYTNELKAMAVELAKIELALEDVSFDQEYSHTRSEFLYSIVGYLCFLNNKIPNLSYSDEDFRTFLLNLIGIYFQGSIPKSIEGAVGLLITEEFETLENFLLQREGVAGLDISDQFGFQIVIETNNQFPPGIFDFQSSLRIILDIVRPAHTLYTIRYIFKDEYLPGGSILDSMRWDMWSYYYEDYRKYYNGILDRDRLGVKENIEVLGEDHSADF